MMILLTLNSFNGQEYQNFSVLIFRLSIYRHIGKRPRVDILVSEVWKFTQFWWLTFLNCFIQRFQNEKDIILVPVSDILPVLIQALHPLDESHLAVMRGFPPRRFNPSASTRRDQIRVASLSLASFRSVSVQIGADLYPISIYIIFSWSITSFLSSFKRSGVLPLEVKNDIFRYGDEGTWTWLSTLPRTGFDTDVCNYLSLSQIDCEPSCEC